MMKKTPVFSVLERQAPLLLYPHSMM